MRIPFVLRSIALLTSVLALLAVPAHAGTITWQNSAGGSFNSSANWSPAQVPGPGDTAVINLAGTYSVSIDADTHVSAIQLGGSSGTQTLTLSGHMLTVDSSFTVGTNGVFNMASGTLAGTFTVTTTGAGQFNWLNGTITGTLSIPAGSAMNFGNGGNGQTISGGTINNAGTIDILTGARTISLNNGAAINNSGTLDNESTGGNSGGISIDSTSAFHMTGGTLSGGQRLVFEGSNSSAINWDAGTVSGSVFVGDHTLTTIKQMTVTGTFTAGPVNSTLTVAFNGAVTVDGGAFNMNGGGIYSGAGTFVTTNNGQFNWFNGTITGTFTIPAGSAMNFGNGGNGQTISGGSINNAGTIDILTGARTISLNNGAAINNSGTLDNESTGGNSGGISIDSTSAFHMTGGTLSGGQRLVFEGSNSSAINWDAGTVSGSVFVGDHTLTTIKQMTVTGTFTAGPVNSTLTVAFNGAVTADGGAFNMNGGGNYSGTGTLVTTNNGQFNWFNGTITGTFTIPAGSAFNFANGGNGQTINGGTINNSGTLNILSGAATISLNNSAAINNSGTVDNESTGGNSGGIFIDGTSIFHMVGGTLSGGQTLTVEGSRPSAVNWDAGTLAGSIKMTGNTQINIKEMTVTGTFNGSASNTNFGVAFNGTVTVDGGAFNMDGNGLFSGTATIVTKGGGTFNWVNGTVTATLNIPVGSALQIAGAGNGSTLNGGVINNQGAITFSVIGSPVGLVNGGTINNSGTLQLGTEIVSDKTGGAIHNLSGGMVFDNSPSAIVVNSNVTFTNAGIVNLNGSELHILSGYTQTGGATLLNGGTLDANVQIQNGFLSGPGVINGILTNASFVTPGSGATSASGILAVIGAYTQTDSGMLNIRLTGETPGTQFDQLSVDGAASLAGTLNILNSFTPMVGDSIPIVTYRSLTGAFSTLSGANIGNGLQYGITYDPSSANLVVQSGGGSATVAILSITPNRGGDIGSVAVSITGLGFQNGAMVKLTRAGQSDIVAQSVVHVQNFLLTANLDLTGKTDGAWNVVVTNPDGTSATLNNGFTIETGIAPRVFADAIGRGLLHVGNPAELSFIYGNSGNIDAPASLFRLIIPKTITIIDPDNPLPALPSGDAVQVEDDGDNSVIVVLVPVVPAGSSFGSPLQLRTDQQGSTTIIGTGQTSPDLNDSANIPVDTTFTITPEVVSNTTTQAQTILHLASAAVTTDLTDTVTLSPATELIPFTTTDTVINGIETITTTGSVAVSAPAARGRDLNSFFEGVTNVLTGVQNGVTQLKNKIVKTTEDLSGVTLHDFRTRFAICLANDGFIDGNDRDRLIRAADGALSFNIVPSVGLPKGGPGGAGAFAAAGVAVNGAFNTEVMRLLAANAQEPGSPFANLSGEQLLSKAVSMCFSGPDFMCASTFFGVSSFDPNDKAGSQGFGSQQFISGETPLRYGIFFENEPTATAPAQQVVITDPLDMQNDDLSTFQLGPISFGSTILTPPAGSSQFTGTADLRPATNLLVRVQAGLNPATGLAAWTLTALDPVTQLPPSDPLLGFLPPDVNPIEGEGTVSYTVMPKTGLATGTTINNQATIVFDQNAPIPTQIWSNAIDNNAPMSSVSALPPVENTASFKVSWSGTDKGSGVRDFNVFVSDNGGPFTLFQQEVGAGSAIFNGQNGHTYSFFSQARDQTNNVEGLKAAGEATTKVVVPQNLGAGISLISLPFDFGGSTADVASLLGLAPIGGLVPIATWDATNLRYAFYPMLPGANGKQTLPGRGYFIDEASPQIFSMFGMPVSSPFVDMLQPGWNLIGNPYPGTLDSATLHFQVPVAVGANPANSLIDLATAVSGKVIDLPIFGYDPAKNQYVPQTTLQPFQGYWIFVDGAATNQMPVTIQFTNTGG